MSLSTQLLRLCTVSVLGYLGLLAVHGLPANTGVAEAAPAQACGAGLVDDGTDIRWISQAEARELVSNESAVFVDCRTLEAFEEGHVSGSLHLPPNGDTGASSFIDTLRSAGTVVTYCSSACERSTEMASRFAAAGLHDVRVLEGGMPAWLDNGFPAESGACNHCDSHN